jgi:anti-anti-sigma regulatory factor
VNDNESDGLPDQRLAWAPGRLPSFARVVVASGDLDDDKALLLGRLVADELNRHPPQLVLELSRTTSVGSAFIDVLTDASATAGEADISFCLVAAPTGPVIEALVAADLIERFDIYTTLSEAQLSASHPGATGAAVIERARRARVRAQTTCEAARHVCERSRRLRRTGLA